MDKEYIKAKLRNLPHQPGSYQMKDKYGEIIYVGKAKDLHARVNQYFVGAHDFKTTRMVASIEDLISLSPPRKKKRWFWKSI